MILRVNLCALLLVGVLLGCGGDVAPKNFVSTNGSRTANAKVAQESDAQAFRFAAPAAENAGGFGSPFGAAAWNALNNPQAQSPTKSAQAVDQKIIYTGTLSVVAKEFDKAEPKVREVVKKHKGFIADAQVQRNQGSRPSATWVIRTPAENFDDCMHDLAEIGIPETQRVATQDVGEEYVDVQSRVASKKKIEERILEMLKNRNGDLKEVLELEGKLGVIREEIERAQGRLNFLTNRVSLSTINLTLREERDYTPPQTPNFATQIADTWTTSTGSFTKFLQSIAIFAVGIAPWLPFWLLFSLAAWIIAKKIHRTALQTKPTA
jgi:hypothetical protein